MDLPQFNTFIKSIYRLTEFDQYRLNTLMSIDKIIPYKFGIFFLYNTNDHFHSPISYFPEFKIDCCSILEPNDTLKMVREDNNDHAKILKVSNLDLSLESAKSEISHIGLTLNVNQIACINLFLDYTKQACILLFRTTEEKEFDIEEFNILDILTMHLQTSFQNYYVQPSLWFKKLLSPDNTIGAQQQADCLFLYKKNLTVKEHVVLLKMIKGATNKSIASDLNISPETVKSHVKNILTKYNVNSRTELLSLIINHLPLERVK